MDKNKELNNRIKKLLRQGYSGSAIAKQLHIRKQRALELIRKIEHKPLDITKIHNPTGRVGFIELDEPSKAFTEALYKQGYPIEYITKLVNKKHSETSKAKIRKYIKQFKTINPNAEDSHKANMRFYKSAGKWRQHIDAKFFRETNKHYFMEREYQFKEGSPKIEIELAEADE